MFIDSPLTFRQQSFSHHSRVRFRALSQDLLQKKSIYTELRLEKTNEGNPIQLKSTPTTQEDSDKFKIKVVNYLHQLFS